MLVWSTLYWATRQQRKAEKQAKTAMARFPRSSVMHRTYAEFLNSTGAVRERVEYLFQKAIELDPDDSITYFCYGKALLSWEEWSESRSMLEKADQLGHGQGMQLFKSHVSFESKED